MVKTYISDAAPMFWSSLQLYKFMNWKKWDSVFKGRLRCALDRLGCVFSRLVRVVLDRLGCVFSRLVCVVLDRLGCVVVDTPGCVASIWMSDLGQSGITILDRVG